MPSSTIRNHGPKELDAWSATLQRRARAGAAAAGCRACELWANATQTVFGRASNALR